MATKKGILQTPNGTKCRYCEKRKCILQDRLRRMKKCLTCRYLWDKTAK